jgi:hypothetical protein
MEILVLVFDYGIAVIPLVIIRVPFIIIVLHFIDHDIFIYCYSLDLMRWDLQSTFILTCLLLCFF